MPKTILLIGDALAENKNAASLLRQAGYGVLTVRDGRAGFHVIRSRRPDLIICEMKLPDVSGLELCRMVRAESELFAIPLVLISGTHLTSDEVFEAFRAGADDCLEEFPRTSYYLAKISWLIVRRHGEENLREYYQLLRSRQRHIAEIIKGTSDLLMNLDSEREFRSPVRTDERNNKRGFDQRLKLGMRMIGALANLLDEQARAIDAGERAMCREVFAADENPHSDKFDPRMITYGLVLD